MILKFKRPDNPLPPEQLARAQRCLKDAQSKASRSVSLLIGLGEAITDGRVERELLEIQEEILNLVDSKDHHHIHSTQV